MLIWKQNTSKGNNWKRTATHVPASQRACELPKEQDAQLKNRWTELKLIKNCRSILNGIARYYDSVQGRIDMA